MAYFLTAERNCGLDGAKIWKISAACLIIIKIIYLSSNTGSMYYVQTYNIFGLVQ